MYFSWQWLVLIHVRCYLLIRMFLRLGTTGWYVVTLYERQSIFLTLSFMLKCGLSVNLTLDVNSFT